MKVSSLGEDFHSVTYVALSCILLSQGTLFSVIDQVSIANFTFYLVFCYFR